MQHEAIGKTALEQSAIHWDTFSEWAFIKVTMCNESTAGRKWPLNDDQMMSYAGINQYIGPTLLNECSLASLTQ